jgi:hypothetical protein
MKCPACFKDRCNCGHGLCLFFRAQIPLEAANTIQLGTESIDSSYSAPANCPLPSRSPSGHLDPRRAVRLTAQHWGSGLGDKSSPFPPEPEMLCPRAHQQTCRAIGPKAAEWPGNMRPSSAATYPGASPNLDPFPGYMTLSKVVLLSELLLFLHLSNKLKVPTWRGVG